MLEGAETIGGGCRSEELTLPGFVHDTCSTVHALALASPFLSRLPLAEHGLELVHPEAPLAHPLDDGSAVLLERSVEATAAALGADARRLPAAVRAARAHGATSSCGRSSARCGRRAIPLALARFGASRACAPRRGSRARASRASARARCSRAAAAHSMLPLSSPPSAAFGLVLMMSAHDVGWPVARGGSQRLADALAAHLRSLGGEIETGSRVESLDELAGAGATLLDVTPRQLARDSPATACPARYRRGGSARYRYGPGVFKLDWALDGPIPWTAPEVRARGHRPRRRHARARSPPPSRRPSAASIRERPFVLLVQPSLFDPTPRARGQAHGLGLLPRPERLDARHDRRDRGAGGALRAGLPGPDRRALGA